VAPSGERGERGERDAAELHEQLVAMADPVRAEGERAYLKHCYEHLGVPMGPGRKLVKEWLRGSRPELDHVLAVAAVLWDSEIYEDRRAAVDLLVEVADQLGPEHLDRLTAMVRDARTWALVDPLGHTVVGKILTRHPEVAAAHGERWSLDDDSFWVRRLRCAPGRCRSRPSPRWRTGSSTSGSSSSASPSDGCCATSAVTVPTRWRPSVVPACSASAR
jgi:hypothetical protein